MIIIPWKVNSCCFCVKLRTGCLIIGYLKLIFNLLIMTPFSIWCVSIIKDIYDDQRLTTIFTVWAALLIIHLIFNIALLVGLHRHKHSLVRAYLIYGIIFIVLGVKLAQDMRGAVYSDDMSAVTPSVSAEATRDLIYLAIYIYFLIVIWSYWFKMKDASKRFAF